MTSVRNVEHCERPLRLHRAVEAHILSGPICSKFGCPPQNNKFKTQTEVQHWGSNPSKVIYVKENI